MDVRCVFVWPFILWKVDRWRPLVGLEGPVNPIRSSSWPERKRKRARGVGGAEGRQKRSVNRKKLKEKWQSWRTKLESPVCECERALAAVIVSTGGFVPSWLQQAWRSDWFRSSIMASYECWVWLRGTIRATMADKTLSAPQRSEGPFHACPGAERAAESWWPAGSLAPVQPNAVSTLSALSCWRMETQGCRVCVTHVGMYTHIHTYRGAPVFSVKPSSAGWPCRLFFVNMGSFEHAVSFTPLLCFSIWSKWKNFHF